jgi:fimbrial chaperone protein
MKIRHFIPLLAIIGLTNAHASGYTLTPMGRVAVDTNQADVLSISNPSQTATKIQVRTFAWSQSGGEDVLTPTREVMASPSMLSLAPGEKKVIRILRMKAATGKEMDYRLILSEIPAPPDPTAKSFGTRVILNVSVPWIYQPDTTASPILTARYQGKDLVVSNTGPVAAKLADLGTGGEKPWKPGLVGWVLPNASRTFPVPKIAHSLTVTVNGKPQTISAQ